MLGDMKNWTEPNQTELNTKKTFGVFMDNSEIIHTSSFVCVEVLRSSQPNGVMSSVVSLPNHTFTGQA